MSIYHLTVKRGSRSKNRLSADKHDYIVRLGRFAQRHDGELAHSESGNMPSWAQADARSFWLETDGHERANATLYHEVEFALPLELSQAQQIECAQEFVRQICGEQHPYSWGLHAKENNPHVHLMFSGRMLDGIERDAEQFFKRYNAKNPERGGCHKEASGDARGPEWVKQIRNDWQDVANRHLAAAGHDARIDHRSHKARGLEKAPGVHLGRKAHRLEKAGKATMRSVRNKERALLNASLRDVQSKIHHNKEKPHEQRPGRNGKYNHNQPASSRTAGTTTPKRAFTAWRDDSAENRQGLRSSRHLGPERMPALRQSRAGYGQQKASNAVLQRTLQRRGGRDYSLHGTRGGSYSRVSSLERAARYRKTKLERIQKAYNSKLPEQIAKTIDWRLETPHGVMVGLVGGARIFDRGDRITTRSPLPHEQEIRTLLAMAEMKGWRNLKLQGTEEFKQAAFIQATRAGLGVVGYTPPREVINQLQEERHMLQARGGVALTPDVGITDNEIARWQRRFEQAHEAAIKELKKAREAKAKLGAAINTKSLAKKLAREHSPEFNQAIELFQEADRLASEETGALARRFANSKRNRAWREVETAYQAALQLPAISKAIADAEQHNSTLESTKELVQRLNSQAGWLEFEAGEFKKNPVDTLARFKQAWEASRKINNRQLEGWQQALFGEVFDKKLEDQKQAEQKAKDAAQALKNAQRQEQAQRQLAAQKQADLIADQLAKAGLPDKEHERLEQQQRYYQALADGHDEAEAKERAHYPKTDALPS